LRFGVIVAEAQHSQIHNYFSILFMYEKEM